MFRLKIKVMLNLVFIFVFFRVLRETFAHFVSKIPLNLRGARNLNTRSPIWREISISLHTSLLCKWGLQQA